MAEQLIVQEDGVFRWEGPKRKSTVINAKLGRLVLTSERLVFLSSGNNDLSAGKFLAGAATSTAVLVTSSTTDLDETALQNPGSLQVPLDRITSAELKGMFKVLVVGYTDEGGAAQYSTFSPKNGGMPAGAAWVESIERARTDLEATR